MCHIHNFLIYPPELWLNVQLYLNSLKNFCIILTNEKLLIYIAINRKESLKKKSKFYFD